MLKNKKLQLIITAAVVIVAAAALFALWYTSGSDDFSQAESGSILINTVKNTQADSLQAIQKSDIENVYYSISPENGEVRFFEYKDSVLSETEPTGKKTITAEVSGQSITAEVTYLQRGSDITGYGLFLNDWSSGVYFYDYFFVKFKNLPKSHLIDKGDVLLLMDENKEDFSKASKTYEQSFYYNMETGKMSRFMNNATDSTDLEGKKRSDYAVLTDEVLDSAGESIVFFTSRYYAVTDPNLDVDLDTKTRSVYKRLAAHAHFMYARTVDEGTLFLRENSDKTGFSAVTISGYGKEEKVVKEFAGSYERDYIRSGDYILNKNTAVATCLITGREISLDNTGVADIKFFAVSPDGGKAVIAGVPADSSKGSQAIGFFDLESGRKRLAYGSGIYTPVNPNFSFGSDYIFFSRPGAGDKIVYTGMVFKWSDIFSAKICDE